MLLKELVLAKLSNDPKILVPLYPQTDPIHNPHPRVWIRPENMDAITPLGWGTGVHIFNLSTQETRDM